MQLLLHLVFSCNFHCLGAEDTLLALKQVFSIIPVQFFSKVVINCYFYMMRPKLRNLIRAFAKLYVLAVVWPFWP